MDGDGKKNFCTHLAAQKRLISKRQGQKHKNTKHKTEYNTDLN